MNEEKINWIIKHLRYTQALCEVILENLPDHEKIKLIDQVKTRVNEISVP